MTRRGCWKGVGLILFALLGWSGAPAAADPDAIKRGEYLFHAGGCYGCHTDIKKKGKPLAGGRALKTPFGTFYGPNITSHPKYGIGRWSDADFVRAMRHGRRPDGRNYFPVFPYTSFTNVTDKDLLDLKAYLLSLPPVAKPNRPHAVPFPFDRRFAITYWKLLNFTRGPFRPDPKRSDRWNRGAYLVRALGHCGECHTPRNFMGGLRHSRSMAGTLTGPEGDTVPNVTPDKATGIGDWSAEEIVQLLEIGMLPDNDFVGGLMGEVVEHGTAKLSPADRQAIADYLRALPPIKNKIGKK